MSDMRDKLVRIAYEAIQPLIRDWYAEEIEAEDAFAAAAVDALLLPDMVAVLRNTQEECEALALALNLSGLNAAGSGVALDILRPINAILSKLEAK